MKAGKAIKNLQALNPDTEIVIVWYSKEDYNENLSDQLWNQVVEIFEENESELSTEIDQCLELAEGRNERVSA